MGERDTIRRFLFENFPVQGKLVHLDASWREVLHRHPYPLVVRDALGQAMAAASLLMSTLKLDGSLTMQLQGDGPLRLLVVRCTSDMSLRGLARWKGHVPEGSLSAMTGEGRLAVTLEFHAEPNRYQSIVPLSGDSIADCLQAYFAASEQLPTRLWLATNDERAAGLLLQRLPNKGFAEDTDAWPRVSMLADTVTRNELLTLPIEDVLRRLFHEEDLRLFKGLPVRFDCDCSRQRVETLLRALGHGEVTSILEERQSVEVSCEFCNRAYRFDPVDVEGIFATEAPLRRPKTVH